MNVGDAVEVISCDGLPSQNYLGKTGIIVAIRPQVEYEIAVTIKGHKYNACFKARELKSLSESVIT